MSIGENINLEEEERCGHLVTAEVKKLWNVQLDLFDQLDRICKKHDIKYFAGGGTMLGAVRHKGFIPWDDDMDFFMLADDYKKFCSVARDELSEPYFFYNYTSESGCRPYFSRLRRSDTTGCTQREIDSYVPPFNLGIFIDIFPLFNVPDKDWRWHLQSMEVICYKIVFDGRLKYRYRKYKGTRLFNTVRDFDVAVYLITKMFTKDYISFCDSFMKLCRKVKESERVGLTSFIPNKQKYVWAKSDYDEAVYMPFENRMVPVPKGYDSILTHQFGNYMEFVKGAAQHSVSIFDADTPYKEMLEKNNILN